jgi:hypothetical protein
MEVHHHPNLHHEKKPWKEYILEGLMIFFAVTMGFFAETIREGISDKAKGREYIRSFVQDLRTDTANISNLVAFDQNKMIALDNLVPCYDSIGKDGQLSSCLVSIIKSSMINRNMSFTDGTMQQLKNAGGFRLLNESDKDSIVAYDHAIRVYQNFESTVFQQRQNIVRDVFVKLVNFKANAMMNTDTVKNDIKTPLFFSNDKQLINEFFNDLLLYRKVNKTQISIIKARKAQASRLIKYFEGKYDIE